MTDLIIVLQEGKVAEQGTHDELMKKEDGLYYAMWQQQNASDEAPTVEELEEVSEVGSAISPKL
jgi:ABC-type multidrug transport system ATPase subunit